MYEPSREFLSFHVAGFSHWYGFEVLHKLAPGAKLRMVAEPDNPYDPCAVALYKGKTKIGYVPRDRNGALSQMLYFGHDKAFECRVTHIVADAHPERMVYARVQLRDKRG